MSVATPVDHAELVRIAADAVMEGVSTVFATLGRALVCLDHGFRVVHVSDGLDEVLGDGAGAQLMGKSAADVFGPELFGPDGSMRRALATGERREGWGATVQLPPAAPLLVSLTGAPLCRALPEVCDHAVAYLLVLRPSTADLIHGAGLSAPTIVAGMVARSPRMLAIFRLIHTLAESDATVLLTGESGTGKELLARALHAQSLRQAGPFVAVNCGALPGELLESELFGHVRGAFTGAIRDRVGRFELASQGTLFLDEVGDLPLPLQVKLLRVLQERTYEPLGESRTRRTEARVIAATNRDLKRAVAHGEFREDLYYRLRVVPIEVPPLRARREDVEPLARFLLDRVAARYGRSLLLGPDAVRALRRYDWPGNVRELENALEYAVAVAPGQTLHADDLPPEVLEATEPSPEAGNGRAPAPTPPLPAADPAAASEREQLRGALDAHRWRRDETAAALGISRTTLWRRMRELGLAR